MTRATAMALIMQRLGKRTGLNLNIITELQQAQQDFEDGEFLPWFLKKSLAGLTTTSGTKAVALPGDFIRETDEGWWLSTSNGARKLYKGSYNDLYERESFDVNYLSGYYYAVVGTSIYHFPTPASVMDITGFYFAQDAMLVADGTENNWLKYASGLMIAKAGIRMSKTLRDAEAFKLFESDYAEAYNKLIAANAAREQAAYNAVMGG